MPKLLRGKDMRKPAAILTVPLDPKLKQLIGEAADRDGVPMNEWIAKIVAKALGRPDLAKIPRKIYGRPRKEMAVS